MIQKEKQKRKNNVYKRLNRLKILSGGVPEYYRSRIQVTYDLNLEIKVKQYNRIFCFGSANCIVRKYEIIKICVFGMTTGH